MTRSRLERRRLVAEQCRTRAVVRQPDGRDLAHVANRVGVAVHLAAELVRFRAPGAEAPFDAVDRLGRVEIGVAQRASRQPVERSPPETGIASPRLIVRRARYIVRHTVFAPLARQQALDAALLVAERKRVEPNHAARQHMRH